jgi:RNA polymerase sigma factor (sigma-70 family)
MPTREPTPEERANALNIAEVVTRDTLRRIPIRPKCCEVGDILQEVRLAGERALRAWREDGGTTLAGYVFTVCVREAERHVRESGCPSRSKADRSRRARKEGKPVPPDCRPPVSLDEIIIGLPDSACDRIRLIDGLPHFPIWQEAAPDAEEAALERLDAARIAGLLERLPDKLRDAVRAVYWEGLTPTEFARREGISRQASFNRLERAIEKLRPVLREAGYG